MTQIQSRFGVLSENIKLRIMAVLRVPFHELRNHISFPHTIIGLFSRISSDCVFEKGVKIGQNTLMKKSSLGKYTYISPNGIIENCKIGSYCSLGPNLKIGMGPHAIKFVSTHPAFYAPNHSYSQISFTKQQAFDEAVKQTVIGNDVWIGADVTIMGGISVGDGAIIATGAIVTKDVPPYTIVGGVPAKVIEARFPADLAEQIQATAWWNKSEEWIHANHELFYDPRKFVESV